MKRPTDKDLRLYARLSDVDSDLIQSSTIPEAGVVLPQRLPLKRRILRTVAAALTLSCIVLALALSLMMDMDLFTPPAGDPSLSDSTTAPPHSTLVYGSPTMENAATLRKGMSMTDVVAALGANCGVWGTKYIYTLDSGEKLTVITESDGGGPLDFAYKTVIGFSWSGDTAEAVNPLGVPKDVLQKLQDYATDKVIPVYTIPSLISRYRQGTLPTVTEVLEGAEVYYLRMSADGSTVTLDREGQTAEFSVGSSLDVLQDVTSVFDESVRIKAYYPILTTRERGAVYFRTSVGDYILYFHGENLPFVDEGGEEADDTVPYLIPSNMFRSFANRVTDLSATMGIGWEFSEACMENIEHYRLTREGYQKPVNLATPEAAAQVEVGLRTGSYGSALTALLGNGLTTTSDRNNGIFYWELTDGRGFVVTTKIVESYSGAGDVSSVTSVAYFDSADMLEDLGQPSLANAALISEGVSLVVAEAVMGAHDHLLVSLSAPCVWTWEEGGLIHSLTVDWKLYTTEGEISLRMTDAKSVTLSKLSPSAAAARVKVGMTRDELVNLLGKSDATAEQQAVGILYWKWDEGKSLFVYCRPEDTSRKDPPSVVASIVWLNSATILDRLGSPSYDAASLIVEGMSREAVTALMGKEISYSYSSGSQLSVSGWSLDHDGLPREFNVYYETVVTASLQTEKRVLNVTLTELQPPDTKPIASLAQAIRIGMADVVVLNVMDSFPIEVYNYGDGFLYVWELNNGQFFGTVMEDLTPDDDGVIRLTVTMTLFCNSLEEMALFSSSPS